MCSGGYGNMKAVSFDICFSVYICRLTQDKKILKKIVSQLNLKPLLIRVCLGGFTMTAPNPNQFTALHVIQKMQCERLCTVQYLHLVQCSKLVGAWGCVSIIPKA